MHKTLSAALSCALLIAVVIASPVAPAAIPILHSPAQTAHTTKTAKTRVATKKASGQTSATLAKKAAPAAATEWWFHPRKDHTPSGAPDRIDLAKYHICYLGDTTRKVVYLTFDEGSEFGYTIKILDTLKEAGVHATFFVTRYYMKEKPELVKRMIAEGHTIGNHSTTHPENLGSKTDQRIKDEVLLAAQYYKGLTGQEMPTLFRPPCGACDEHTLGIIAGLGWRPVFWSMAYQDYDLNKQKGAKFAAEFVNKYYHPGAVILLHPFPSNAEALGTIIKELKAAGYEFGSLLDVKGAPAKTETTKIAQK